MEKLASYFNNLGLAEQAIQTIVAAFKKQRIKKGDYFVKEGKKSAKIGYVESGQLQYYSINEKGEERTTYISLANSFVASLLAYLTDSPARENIRALSDSVVWTIDRKEIISLQKELPAFKDFYIGLIEWQICCIDKAKFDLITLTAEERYEKVLKEEPELIQQVPLQYIASMLGITPRHLSRLRRNV